MLLSRFLTIFCVSATIFSIYAHINKTSLSIKGGEVFIVGDTIRITWKIAIFHNRPHFIYFSPGTGQAWQKIDSVPEKSDVMDMSYTWTVPQTPSSNARIRIFQSFVASPGEQTNDYTIVSNTFTISSGATTLISKKNSDQAILRKGKTVREGAMFNLNGRLVDKTSLAGKAGRGFISRRIVAR